MDNGNGSAVDFPFSAPTLIVVSNRLPVSLKKDKSTWTVKMSSGGLVAALSGLEKSKVNSVWVGWPGCGMSKEDQEIVTTLLKEKKCVPVFLSEKISDEHYNGFSNGILWPLFHYLHNNINFDDKLWSSYLSANQTFADTVESIYKPGDILWIHDMHLMLVPKMLRRQLPNAKIGFFLHIPFPCVEIFRVCPWKAELLLGVLECDLIGFHTYEYVQNFLRACTRILELKTSPNGVHFRGKFVRVGVFPIGIEPEKFLEKITTDKVQKRVEELQKIFEGKQVIIGVDRLDYIKGIPHKLVGFEAFLAKYAQFRDKVVLIQIAVPSREDVPEYKKLKNETDELVGRINGNFKMLNIGGIAPVQYLYRSVDMDELTALYRIACCCFVTSIRDGMNLVCLEYITCQQGKYGTLILSEFAGAAQSLCGGAFLVNPWNTDELVDALYHSLTLSRENRKLRHELMFSYTLKYTSLFWAQLFVTELTRESRETEIQNSPRQNTSTSIGSPRQTVPDLELSPQNGHDIKGIDGAINNVLSLISLSPKYGNGISSRSRNHSFSEASDTFSPKKSRPTSPLSFLRQPIKLPLKVFLSSYRESKKRLFIFSYEGTLISSSGHSYQCKPSWKLISQLKELASKSENEIVILSSFDQKTMEEWFKVVPKLILASDNGIYLKKCGENWVSLFPDFSDLWKDSVRSIFKYYTIRTPGSRIQETALKMVWDYVNCDFDFGKDQARDLYLHLDGMPLEVISSHCYITVTPHQINSSSIIFRILSQIKDVDFVMCGGHFQINITDIVSVFSVKEEDCFVFQVGETTKGKNMSPYYLSDVDEITELIEHIVAVS